MPIHAATMLPDVGMVKTYLKSTHVDLGCCIERPRPSLYMVIRIVARTGPSPALFLSFVHQLVFPHLQIHAAPFLSLYLWEHLCNPCFFNLSGVQITHGPGQSLKGLQLAARRVKRHEHGGGLAFLLVCGAVSPLLPKLKKCGMGDV